MTIPQKYPPPAGHKHCEVKWQGLDYWQPIHDFLVFYYMDSFGDAKKYFDRLKAGEELQWHFMKYRYIKPVNMGE